MSSGKQKSVKIKPITHERLEKLSAFYGHSMADVLEAGVQLLAEQAERGEKISWSPVPIVQEKIDALLYKTKQPPKRKATP